MKLIVRLILLLVLVLPVALLVGLWMCFEDVPRIEPGPPPSAGDIARAKALLKRHDPRRNPGPPERELSLSERDLDLLLDYAASRFGRGAAQVNLAPERLRLQLSAGMPPNPFGSFVNVDADVRVGAGVPQFESLRIGRVHVPAALADRLLVFGLRRWAESERGALASEVLRDVAVSDQRIKVRYLWNDELAQRVSSVAVSADQLDRLRFYQERLVETVAKSPQQLSLAVLMTPIFRHVRDRAAEGDEALESRAAIVILSSYVVGREPAEILPAAAAWPRAVRRRVTLAGRDDFPKHFLVSAAIAAEAGSALADAVGLYKELDDANGGSGFSFNDIAADRAGTRFGEIAADADGGARRLAQALARGVREADFMPAIADLPEFMSQAEFERRFGGVGGKAYAKMMATIESRVAALPLLR